MRILAIETVGTTGSVAALDDERVLAERGLDPRGRSAQTLVPGIAELLEHVGWRTGELELVAVASGPGSFTGLRIGVTTAKVLAYTIGCPVVGVHTLLAIAARVPRDVCAFAAVLDAQRGELFVADFRRLADGKLVGHLETRIERREAWLTRLSPGDVVSGPGLAKLAETLPRGVVALKDTLELPTASAVGQVALESFRSRESTSAFDLLPVYYRAVAAEEQWDRKRKSEGAGHSRGPEGKKQARANEAT